MKQRFGFTWTLVVVLGGLMAASNGVASRALAQGKAGSWEVLIAYDPVTKPKVLPRIALRPNLVQPVYAFLKNTGLLPNKNLALTLVRLGDLGKEQILAQAKMDKLVVNQPVLIQFKEEPPAKVPPAPMDDGPPFQFQLWVQEGGKDAVKLDLPVTIQQPHEYTHVDTSLYDLKRKRLSVKVEVSPDSAEPPCKVELVLDPELIPGLIRPKAGLFKDELNLKNRQVELFADNLKFVDVPPKNGRVYLTIDGYERAYMFKSTFEEGNLKVLRDQTRVRLKAPRYFTPAEDKVGPKGEVVPAPKLVLNLEADGVAEPDVRLELAFDRGGVGKFVTQRIFPSLREQSIAASAGKDGSVQFKTLLRDWRHELDTTGVFGRRLVRLRVLAAGRPLPLADEQNLKDESLILFSRDHSVNPYAPLSYDGANRSIVAEIMVDATGPEGVRFVDLPSQVFPGEKLRLKSTAKKRSDQEQAPFGQVLFFVGDPQKDPPLPGLPDKESHLWQADVMVPSDAKDKWTVAVQFSTAAGLVARASAVIPVGAQPKDVEKTQITGKVISRFGKGVKGVDVVLAEKGKLKATTKSKDEGVYLFEDVPPGNYTVSAVQSGTRGSAVVTVRKGKTEEADIKMKLIP